jgi:hypothetical protein
MRYMKRGAIELDTRARVEGKSLGYILGSRAGETLKRKTTKCTALQLIINDNAVRNSLILSTLTIVAISSSEYSVLTRATRRHIPDDGILHGYRRDNLKSYKERPIISLSSIVSSNPTPDRMSACAAFVFVLF